MSPRKAEKDLFANVCALIEQELCKTGKAIISVNGIVAGDVTIKLPVSE